MAGLTVSPEELHRAPKAEERIVVRRRRGRDGLELLRRALVSLGVKERASQRLADRRLRRL